MPHAWPSKTYNLRNAADLSGAGGRDFADPSNTNPVGGGNLSEQRMAEFATFFLEACIDQVRFMETLMQPQRRRERIIA